MANTLPKSITFIAVDQGDNGTSAPNCNIFCEGIERDDRALRNKITEQINETLKLWEKTGIYLKYFASRNTFLWIYEVGLNIDDTINHQFIYFSLYNDY